MSNKTLAAQDFSKHQWENRLLILLTQDTSSTSYQNQLEELGRHKDGLAERKIILYQLTPSSYKTGVSPFGKWQPSSKWFAELKTENTNFEIQLIGLDGGLKLSQSELMSCGELFGIIDKMPMRKNELKNKKQ